MTDMTLKNALFGADAANPALRAVGNVQKTAQSAAGGTQDFGAVLDKTAQKLEKPKQTTADNSAKSRVQQPEETAVEPRQDVTAEDTDVTAEDTDAAVEDTDAAMEEKRSDITSDRESDIAENAIDDTVKEMPEKISETKEPVDEMVIGEIANTLGQLMEQLKEILGITDEELLSGMDKLELQPYDLLDSGNMAQLVTAISGEDSVISLVANEELYKAVQDITKMVDTQVEGLLDKTGLTSEELDTVLQKLQQMESQNPEEPVQESEILIPETVNDEPAAEITVEDTAATEVIAEETVGKQAVREPVVIREDNTKSDDQPAKQYDKLPESQQENPVEVSTKSQTQNTGKDAKNSDGSDKSPKNFGQDSTTQNFQNHLNEVNDMAAAEGIEKFTSESTENIMRQLADMVKIVRNENLTEMELQLHPASLGTVNVSLTTKGGVVTAEFTTQNEAVKTAIEAQASQLRANLEEQGIRIEAIEVSVESHQMERNLDKNGQEQQRQTQEQENGRIQGVRRGRSSINLRAFADGEELEGEMQGADDATRIAMEIMAANGNTMDLLV